MWSAKSEHTVFRAQWHKSNQTLAHRVPKSLSISSHVRRYGFVLNVFLDYIIDVEIATTYASVCNGMSNGISVIIIFECESCNRRLSAFTCVF